MPIPTKCRRCSHCTMMQPGQTKMSREYFCDITCEHIAAWKPRAGDPDIADSCKHFDETAPAQPAE